MTNPKIDNLIACVEELQAARREYTDHATRGLCIALGDAAENALRAWKAMQVDDVVELVGMLEVRR